MLDWKVLFPLLKYRAERQLEPFRSHQLDSLSKLQDALLALGAAARSGKTHVQHCQLNTRLYHDSSAGEEIWAVAPPGNTIAEAEQTLVSNIVRGQLGEKELSYNANKLSTAMLVRCGGQQVLLGSDVPAETWKTVFASPQFPELSLGALKVCHHGSTADNPPAVLDRLIGGGPARLAIVTRYSPQRLPRPGVLRSLEQRFAQVVVLGTRTGGGQGGRVRQPDKYNVERIHLSLRPDAVYAAEKVAM